MDSIDRARGRLVAELQRLSADCERARLDNERDRKAIRRARKRIAKRSAFLKTCTSSRKAIRAELRALKGQTP